MTVLVPILGDQCSHGLSSLRCSDPADTVVLMMEVQRECTYVRHHQHKIVLVLSAMRHFAAELRERGWTVDYVQLDDPGNRGSFSGEVARALKRYRPERIRVCEPGEWRVRQAMSAWSSEFKVPVDVLEDDRFICPLPDFFAWAARRRHPIMEFFYREMRVRTGLLMEQDGEPVGGRWNFDKDNRSGPPHAADFPSRRPVEPDAITHDVMQLVVQRFGDHFGDASNFSMPVTAANAVEALDEFIATRLPLFGTYQDAMVSGEDLLFHAAVSASMNCGLLDPLETCRKVEAAWRAGVVPLNSAEGFIRQIIGWREFMRGMYWLDMPGLGGANSLGATRPLPDFYWTGDTDMHCLSECVRNTRDNAYAHHIQRLMVLGNFAMLAGVEPKQISDWFLVVYADAYEWVEHPNVIGMSQHADGGRIGTKPYAASGTYIDRMSDYCGHCYYDPARKVGPRACPFNALYWDFLDRNRFKLEANRRIANNYRTWDRMSEQRRIAYRDWAARTLASLKPASAGWARGANSLAGARDDERTTSAA